MYPFAFFDTFELPASIWIFVKESSSFRSLFEHSCRWYSEDFDYLIHLIELKMKFLFKHLCTCILNGSILPRWFRCRVALQCAFQLECSPNSTYRSPYRMVSPEELREICKIGFVCIGTAEDRRSVC